MRGCVCGGRQLGQLFRIVPQVMSGEGERVLGSERREKNKSKTETSKRKVSKLDRASSGGVAKLLFKKLNKYRIGILTRSSCMWRKAMMKLVGKLKMRCKRVA